MGRGLGKALLEADQRVTDEATPEMAMRGCNPLAGRGVLLAGVAGWQGWASGRYASTRAPAAEAGSTNSSLCKLTYVNEFDIMYFL
jgi:hypothetical protein